MEYKGVELEQEGSGKIRWNSMRVFWITAGAILVAAVIGMLLIRDRADAGVPGQISFFEFRLLKSNMMIHSASAMADLQASGSFSKTKKFWALGIQWRKSGKSLATTI